MNLSTFTYGGYYLEKNSKLLKARRDAKLNTDLVPNKVINKSLKESQALTLMDLTNPERI
jgi:hypothetical protein